jgi:hypothetical protein
MTQRVSQGMFCVGFWSMEQVRRFTTLMVFLLGACTAFGAVAAVDPLRLEPDMDQRYASSIATRFLTNYHYKQTRLDDELSSQIFDSYLELLDPNRIYFLAGDVESFERYRHSMDDALRHSDLLSAYEIFNVYAERVQQRVDYARSRVKQPFDFTSITSTTAKANPGRPALPNWTSCGVNGSRMTTCACC